jgi:hypothetical protein
MKNLRCSNSRLKSCKDTISNETIEFFFFIKREKRIFLII